MCESMSSQIRVGEYCTMRLWSTSTIYNYLSLNIFKVRGKGRKMSVHTENFMPDDWKLWDEIRIQEKPIIFWELDSRLSGINNLVGSAWQF